MPLVSYAEEDTLGLRLASAVDVARDASWPRVSVLLPGTMWLEAARARSAQHYAITPCSTPLLRLAGVATGDFCREPIDCACRNYRY